MDKKSTHISTVELIDALIAQNRFTIEEIDKLHPVARMRVYRWLRSFYKLHVKPQIEDSKYLGREAVDELEKKLKETNERSYNIFKILRALFYF